VYNAERWIVKNYNSENVKLVSPDDADVTITIPSDDFANFVRPAYAITAYRSQGATFRHPYSIYDWHKMDDRMRYVAISRGTTIDHVNILDRKPVGAVENKGDGTLADGRMVYATYHEDARRLRKKRLLIRRRRISSHSHSRDLL